MQTSICLCDSECCTEKVDKHHFLTLAHTQRAAMPTWDMTMNRHGPTGTASPVRRVSCLRSYQMIIKDTWLPRSATFQKPRKPIIRKADYAPGTKGLVVRCCLSRKRHICSCTKDHVSYNEYEPLFPWARRIGCRKYENPAMQQQLNEAGQSVLMSRGSED